MQNITNDSLHEEYNGGHVNKNAKTLSGGVKNNGGSKVKSLRWGRVAVLVALVEALVVAGCVERTHTEAEVTDSAVANAEGAKEYVKDSLVTITTGPENMRRYTYTGEWANGLPNGYGYAYFDGWSDSHNASYEGRFVNGVCDDNSGEAVLNIFSGDQYSGIFKDGYCVEGCFALENGNFFEGTFQKGKPYNGKWTCSDSSPISIVEDGVETMINP